MNCQNKPLKLPEIVLLKNNLKEASYKLGELASELDDVKYKNSVLIAKGKELEKKLNEITNNISRKDEICKEIKREELYKSLLKLNKTIMTQNRKLKKQNKELIYRLHNK